jgi:hypothetical protein
MWAGTKRTQRAVHLRDANPDRLQIVTVAGGDVGALDVERHWSEWHLGDHHPGTCLG